MKINDFLEGINMALDSERSTKELSNTGHFTAAVQVKKAMGPYKQCVIEIFYVSLPNKETISFTRTTFMERALVDHTETLISNTSKSAIAAFMIKMQTENNWNKIVEGNYGSE